MLSQEILKAYQRRWELVAEVEAEEKRQASVEQRWQKLNSLFRIAAALNLRQRDDDAQIQLVRERWNRLRSMESSIAGNLDRFG